MKELIQDLTKKQRIIVVISSLLLVCVLSVITMLATGVLEIETKGSIDNCSNYGCGCHKTTHYILGITTVSCGNCDACKEHNDKN